MSDQEKDIIKEGDIEDITRVAKLLNSKTYHKFDLTPEDYQDWLNGGNNYGRFETAVKAFLTPALYETAECLARTDAFLRYKLGIGDVIAGGVDLSIIK